MKLEEGFAVISGKVSQDLSGTLGEITDIWKEKYKGVKKARHEWVSEVEDARVQTLVNRVSEDPAILSGIAQRFPNTRVTPVKDIDEIYWSVSPKDATASDKMLVNCHYDGPFSMLPTGGVIFYRVLVGCNENNEVTTHFPQENVSVKMSTADYHGFEYNKDYHCVDGAISSGKYRVVLKLHYMVIPEGSERWVPWVYSINKWWAVFSRNMLNMSAEPKNPLEWVLAKIILAFGFIYLNLYYFIGGAIALYIAKRYLPKKYSLRALWRLLFR